MTSNINVYDRYIRDADIARQKMTMVDYARDAARAKQDALQIVQAELAVRGADPAYQAALTARFAAAMGWFIQPSKRKTELRDPLDEYGPVSISVPVIPERDIAVGRAIAAMRRPGRRIGLFDPSADGTM